ncbi:universal stress protein [Kitasatospora aureofaciens]|uniref:universal stress protein n=1 Tax=Kitasatospora aureofaciens TaxID=1894 RepID=UPI000524080E|nr:universal stress protein [Kitasatospora aureofaciens]HJD82823.1 universal stress protein [Kitasatospora aureofaciens]
MSHAIVVGVDGSEPSKAAAEWAARQAYRSGRPLWMIHAGAAEEFTPTEADGGGEFLPQPVLAVRDHITRVLPGLEVTCRHVPGNPAYALVAAGGRDGQLVVGSRGSGGLTGLLVGSIALRTAARAHCPVVLVRAGADGPAADSGDVVVGLDSALPSGEVLAFAFEQAAARAATLRALESRTLPAGPYLTEASVGQPEIRDSLAAAELVRLQDTLAPWREKFPQVRVEAEVTAWPAGRALVEASRGASLTVVGRRTSGLHSAAPWLGGVAHTVLHHAHSPVAVVPHD